MMLYGMDELVYVFKGVGANDLDGQCIVAYEILDKKCCNTLGYIYPQVSLDDVDSLKNLAWAMYNGVFVPGKPPVLIGYHNRSCIIFGITPHLIFCGKTSEEHYPPCKVASCWAKQASGPMGQQEHQSTERRRKP